MFISLFSSDPVVTRCFVTSSFLFLPDIHSLLSSLCVILYSYCICYSFSDIQMIFFLLFLTLSVLALYSIFTLFFRCSQLRSCFCAFFFTHLVNSSWFCCRGGRGGSWCQGTTAERSCVRCCHFVMLLFSFNISPRRVLHRAELLNK